MTVTIVQAGHPVLRAEAALVPQERFGTRELRDLVATMVEVMRAAPGVGLAAPQIGVGLRVLVMEDSEALMSKLSPEERAARGRTPLPLVTFVNPTIVRRGGGRAVFFEGCLSVAGYMAIVSRDLEVEVAGVDVNGDPIRQVYRGWPARIAQHEIDHLGGTLYIDRMISRTFACYDEIKARWLGKAPEEILAALGAEG